MAKIETSVVIDRSAETVWKFYTDLSNIPRLDPDIREATQSSPGPFGMGSTVSIKGGDWTLDLQVTEYEPNRRLVYECVSPAYLKGSTDSYNMEPSEGKTRFIETLDVKSSGLYRLAGSFFGKRAREDSENRLGALKRILESKAD